jgi:hypothetical protein
MTVSFPKPVLLDFFLVGGSALLRQYLFDKTGYFACKIKRIKRFKAKYRSDFRLRILEAKLPTHERDKS